MADDSADNEDTNMADHSSGSEDAGYETDSNRSFFEDGIDAMYDYPARDIPEDFLRQYIRDTTDIVRHPIKASIHREEDAESRARFAARNQDLKDELQRRKDEGKIPQSEPSNSECNCSDCDDNNQQDSNSGGGSGGDNGIGTSSTTTNNKTSTGSDNFSSFSNDNSPDNLDNFFESDYLFDSLNLDSSILDFVILYLPYIRIVWLLLPFVFFLISKLL